MSELLFVKLISIQINIVFFMLSKRPSQKKNLTSYSLTQYCPFLMLFLGTKLYLNSERELLVFLA